VPADYHSFVKATMFESHYSKEILDQLPNCLRVLPHHQNTSGFFITIIEKTAEVNDALPEVAQCDAKLTKISDVI